MRILLTGARAPVTLELARAFAASGHEVFAADSFGPHLLRGSRAVTRSYRVPAPRLDPDARAFAEGLRDVIRKEAIELLVPTCEEIFHVARRLDLLAPQTRVLTSPIEVLTPLHDKHAFAMRTRAAGVDAPETELVTDRAHLAALVRERGPHIVLKPAFSRFASNAIVSPRDLSRVDEVSTRRAWVVQERLRGTPIATFSVAHEGRLTLHSAYALEVTAGPRAGEGSAILFRPLDDPRIERWVSAFVARERFTGQVAFDLFDVPSRGIVAIECNPRATSGAHLFRDDPRLARAYVAPDAPLATPRASASAMLALPMMLYGPRQLGRHFVSTLRRSRDVAWDRRDPLASVVQIATAAELVRRAIAHRCSPLEASTIDIEWNGPDDVGGRS
ncbi:MAG: hypothetical protein K1X94_08155 [Sandaracinaceae bacterium]|nr:hypothetical protein [Sandaracinaceae bacterium]